MEEGGVRIDASPYDVFDELRPTNRHVATLADDS